MINKLGGGRIIGLDLLRSFAIFSVIAGHFVSINTKFWATSFQGISMFLQATSYVIFALGVPWFLMLTGFLNRNKTVNRDYYKGCIRVLVSYVFFSVVTILFRKYYLMEELSWIEWGKKILDFTAIPYAWYIEMWIGLFLLTPFLNMLYKAIPTQRQKKMLLLTLLLLVAVAFTLNT